MLFGALCQPLCEAGLNWLYFAIMGIVGILLSFIGSVMMTKSQLYDAKDNELLLSMPISPGQILAGRLLSLLLLNYIYQSFVMIPAGVIYRIMEGVFGHTADQLSRCISSAAVYQPDAVLHTRMGACCCEQPDTDAAYCQPGHLCGLHGRILLCIQ